MKKGLPDSKKEIYVPSLIKKLNLRNPAKFLKICKFAFGIATYFVGVSFAYSYFHQSAEIPAEKRKEVGGTAFDDLAPYYDSKLALDEFFMGISKLRKRLISQAKGNTLEIACGTGKNIPYYTLYSVKSVIGIDSSNSMLEEARNKVINHPKRNSIFQFINGNVEKLDFEDNSFDSVIDTFGICSITNPILAINEMQRVCKPDGKIILIEHGRSNTFSFLSNYLDKHSEKHYENWGCMWNKDINKIVEESGLIITEKGTKNFGTTYYYIGSPNKKE